MVGSYDKEKRLLARSKSDFYPGMAGLATDPPSQEENTAPGVTPFSPKSWGRWRNCARRWQEKTKEAEENYCPPAPAGCGYGEFEKRRSGNRAELLQFANENLVKELLPVVDNLERALDHGRQLKAPQALLEGIEMVHQGFLKVLDRFGVTAHDSLGQQFDPAFHNAMMQEEAPDVPNGSVIKELQKGYLMNQRLLRPAMVVVASNTQNETTSGQTTRQFRRRNKCLKLSASIWHHQFLCCHYGRWRAQGHPECGGDPYHPLRGGLSRERRTVGGADRQAPVHHQPFGYRVFRRTSHRRNFSDPEVQRDLKISALVDRPGRDGDAHVDIRGRVYSPAEISSMILTEMNQTRGDTGKKVTEAVITVPAYFSDAQRQATGRRENRRARGARASSTNPAASMAYGLDERRTSASWCSISGGCTLTSPS